MRISWWKQCWHTASQLCVFFQTTINFFVSFCHGFEGLFSPDMYIVLPKFASLWPKVRFILGFCSFVILFICGIFCRVNLCLLEDYSRYGLILQGFFINLQQQSKDLIFWFVGGNLQKWSLLNVHSVSLLCQMQEAPCFHFCKSLRLEGKYTAYYFIFMWSRLWGSFVFCYSWNTPAVNHKEMKWFWKTYLRF